MRDQSPQRHPVPTITQYAGPGPIAAIAGVDSSHTSYWGFEYTGSGNVGCQIPYPYYWSRRGHLLTPALLQPNPVAGQLRDAHLRTGTGQERRFGVRRQWDGARCLGCHSRCRSQPLRQ